MAITPRPTYNPAHVTMMDSKTGIIPTTESSAILTSIKTGSAFMKLAKAVPMDKPIVEFTHMSGVSAYWTNETERKKTSAPTFEQMSMRAYKLAVIVPVSDETLMFSIPDFFTLMRDEIAQAFYTAFDVAAFANVNSPYDKSILQAATAAGYVFNSTASAYDDINKAMGLIEQNDLRPNGIATTLKQLSTFRSSKDGNGVPMFNPATGGDVDRILGLPVAYMPSGSIGDPTISAIVGDWNQAYYGILQDIQYMVLDQATLTTMTSSDGAPVNLAERDMQALRATMMVGMMVVEDKGFSVIKTPVAP